MQELGHLGISVVSFTPHWPPEWAWRLLKKKTMQELWQDEEWSLLFDALQSKIYLKPFMKLNYKY